MMARGAARAIAAENRQNGLKIISIDGENSTINMVANGKIYSTTIYPVAAPMDIVAAAKLIAGEPLPGIHQARFTDRDKGKRRPVQGQELLRTD